MQKVVLLFIASINLLLCSCRNTSTRSPGELVMEYHNEGHFNGTVLIAKDNVIIYDTLLGYSDFNHNVAFKKQTPFYIASLAKPITAIGIMLLQQKGLLSYDDRISQYVTGLPGYAKDITIRQLLTHTSGLRDYEGVLIKKGLTNLDVVQWLQGQPLQFKPGSQFQYSNTGYIILSLLIESVSHTSYRSYLQEQIFTPVQMRHTQVVDETKPLIEPKAIGFSKEKTADDYTNATTGDGGIYATTEDLYNLDQALRKNVLLTAENTKLMYQPQMLSNGKPGPYGFGWFIENTAGSKTASHTGGLNGFRAIFWRDLEKNETIIALTNQGDAFALNDFLNALIKSIR